MRFAQEPHVPDLATRLGALERDVAAGRARIERVETGLTSLHRAMEHHNEALHKVEELVRTLVGRVS
jgi:hypothetical protein